MTDAIDNCAYNLFRRHKFEPRYDTSKADLSGLNVTECSVGFADKFRTITYVKDVCIRCGKEVKR